MMLSSSQLMKDNHMNENLKLAIIGIGAGVFGMTVWYAEMFTDFKTGRCQWVVAMSSLNASVGVR